MSYLSGSIVNNQSLNGIISITDGSNLTIEDGKILNCEFLDCKEMEIDSLKSISILPVGFTLQIGEIGKNTIIYGSNITLLGNISAIESVNVEFSDHNLQLNYNGTDAMLPGSGLSVCGDNNDIKASLQLDSGGDWVFNSSNNKLSVANLVVGNITIETPIVYDSFTASNITASNKFITQNVAILDRTVSRTCAISHLNTNTMKSNKITSTQINTANITASDFIVNKNNFDLSTINLFSQQENGYLIFGSLMVQWGTVPDAGTQIAYFNPNFGTTPYNIQATRQQITSGGSSATGALRILGADGTYASFDSATGSGDKTAIYWLAIGPV